MVGVRRFELPAPASRRQCSTRLSYTPKKGPTKGAYFIEWLPLMEDKKKGGQWAALFYSGSF